MSKPVNNNSGHKRSVPKQEIAKNKRSKLSFLKRDSVKHKTPRRPKWTDEKVVLPGCRVAYPGWITFALAGVLILILTAATHFIQLRPAGYLIFAGLCLILAFWWRHESNGELRNRLPNKGWQSEIEPEKLVFLSMEDFNGSMRFELKGDDDDDIENHRVRFASRRSRDLLFFARIILCLAPMCLVGAVVFPQITIKGSGAELPQVYALTTWWLLACPCLIALSGLMKLDWNYNRLMLDESVLYILRENPAWMPWIPGKNDPYQLQNITWADSEDTWWGKQWGHGTVKLKVMLDYGSHHDITLRRVPEHRKLVNTINTMISGGGMMPMMGGAYR